jgi:CrcB protein
LGTEALQESAKESSASPTVSPSASWERGGGAWFCGLARNRMFLIMAGGAIGSYLRYWLPSMSAPASLGPLVGGAIGSYLRYWLSRWFNATPWGQTFPYGTLVVNVSGSFILGLAGVIILKGLPAQHQDWSYLLIGTGFCGGYTTFSTFEWETFKLVRDGSWRHSLANVLGSVFAGFVAVLLAVALAGLALPTHPWGQTFPFGTLLINVSGSFILAVAAVIFLERLPPKYQDWYLLIGTGFCGGYTTFSTLEWETFKLASDGSWWYALANVGSSVIAGFFAVAMAVISVGLIFPKRNR